MRKVLVYGLGVSGISSVKALASMGYEVYTYDKNKTTTDELKGYNYSPISDSKILENNYEFVVKSPGIKPSDDMVQKLSSRYEMLSDIELSFRLFPDKKFVAVTGTNGKTSTTSMISHILNESGIKAISVGNIGEGILWRMYKEEAVFVEELSSFQLKNTSQYHPHIASILNITPDHIDWHGSLDDYIGSKLNIDANQDSSDFLIINHDDPTINEHRAEFKADVYEFSSKSKIECGLYTEEGMIKFAKDGKVIDVLKLADLKIIGNHNYENLMAAILTAYLYGLSFEQIAKAAKTFTSIEHRLEFVDEVSAVKIYNDSKATNVDSAIKAIESFSDPLIIIAGGYDKKIDYTDFIKAFMENGKLMILMGETKHQLAKLCEDYKIDYQIVEDMEEAVKLATSLAEANDVILLAPASASWDMYESYEARGREFKKYIEKYKGNIRWK